MSVREYTTKFMEKSRLAEFFICIDEGRVESDIWGLRATIQEFVQIQKPCTFLSDIDDAEGHGREKKHQGEDIALGKIKWDGTKNDFKKIKTSCQERKVDQMSRVMQCLNCNHYHKGSVT